MDAFPLEIVDLDEARRRQFRLVEMIAGHFDGDTLLRGGDLGLWPDAGRPHATARVEAVLAEFFGAPDACLVRGAGTGALRALMMAALKPNQRLLLHRAPIYPTTRVTIEAMGLEPMFVDMNDRTFLDDPALETTSVALVQHTRQRIEDRYHLGDVIAGLRMRWPDMTVLVDDNYAAMRVPRIGIELGADASTFSLFKLGGPEGIGCVLAEQGLVDRLRAQHYSGGTQVQGPEALEALRALVLAPVMLAIQGETVHEVCRRLNAGEVPGVVRALVTNAQSCVVLVELERPNAEPVLQASIRHGAAGHPVGAESRYEILPLFYRVSGTFREENPALAQRMLRINPMRAGADLIINILNEALADCRGV